MSLRTMFPTSIYYGYGYAQSVSSCAILVLTLARAFTASLSLVHTSDISISNENKGWILLWDLRRQNNETFSLFRLLFCSFLMLGLWSYAYDDPYVAGLTWFLCFAFCFALMLMLMLSCEPGFTIIHYNGVDRLPCCMLSVVRIPDIAI